MTNDQCACVIPFHNEQERMLNVLEVATRVGGLSRIVCVDDGSDDNASALIERHFPSTGPSAVSEAASGGTSGHRPQVTIVRLPQNRGKTEAIREGVRLVKTPYTLLLDADLRFLEAEEISLVVTRIVSDPTIDMIILRRVKAGLHARISRGDVLFSGERILRTGDLRRVLQTRPEGYQIEIAINKYMLDHHKTVYWMPSSAVNTYKMVKMGLIAGLMQDLMMTKNMVSYGGLGTYIEQLLSFAKQRAVESLVPQSSSGDL